MRWWVRFAVGICVWCCWNIFSNNTPGFCFNAHNSQQWQYV